MYSNERHIHYLLLLVFFECSYCYHHHSYQYYYIVTTITTIHYYSYQFKSLLVALFNEKLFIPKNTCNLWSIRMLCIQTPDQKRYVSLFYKFILHSLEKILGPTAHVYFKIHLILKYIKGYDVYSQTCIFHYYNLAICNIISLKIFVVFRYVFKCKWLSYIILL